MTFSPAIYGRLADLAAPFEPPPAGVLSDDELLEAQRTLAAIRRRADAAAAVVAGEIAHRSRPALGHAGLAQARGMRTPELLVQQVTGASKHAARTLVRVGAVLTAPEHENTAGDAPSPEPWLREIAAAGRASVISLEAVEAIRAGLGAPTDAVTADALAEAADRLLAEAPTLTVEKLAIRAREERAALDDDAIAERAELLRSRRFLHLTPLADGMTRISGLLDPESAAIVTSAFDAATSPRRGGPRFVDATAASAADELIADTRTTEQIGLDALVDLIRMGARVSPDVPLAGERPAVRLHVRAADLRDGRGAARIEGRTEPLPLAAAERHLCDAGAVPIAFDASGQPLDVGRTQRLFTHRQRIALAARDGGCRFPECDRPPSWTEAHHLLPWQQGGRTDIANGLLLCRHHHLLVHDAGWAIERRGGDYFFTPPPGSGRMQEPIAAPAKYGMGRQSVPAA